MRAPFKRFEIVTQHAMWVATFLVVASSPALAQSGSARYRFTTVLDSLRDGLVATRCAAINGLGTVAVQAEDPVLGINKLLTKRGANDRPVLIADTREVRNFPTVCDNGIDDITSNPSINDLDEVAFQGNLEHLDGPARCETPQQNDDPRQGVFLGRGGPLTTVAHTNNPPGARFISEFVVADTSVNNFGKVALAIELRGEPLFDQGLFVGSRTGAFEERFRNSTSLFDTPSSRMSLNEAGQIAFLDNGIVLSNPDGTFRRIVDSNSGEFSVFDPSLNNQGRVAFTGSRFVGDTQVQGVFTSRGGPVTTVADSTGPYAFFGEPSLNDLGDVVFTAGLDDFTNGGVFTGDNPRTDKVLRTGDTYEGVLVTSLFTCSEALNNLGQIVMTVQSQDPDTFEVRTFIVKATPRNLRND